MSEDLPPTMRDSDRNDCGGVGGCGLMRAEHDAEVEVIACLESAARQEVSLSA